MGDGPRGAAEQVPIPPEVATFTQTAGSISVDVTWVERNLCPRTRLFRCPFVCLPSVRKSLGLMGGG